jgi:L-threonylcarbamoyladenylate synthase
LREQLEATTPIETQYLDAHQVGTIDKAASLLLHGRLVVFPTDTVYGLGADAFDAAAIQQLYAVKERALHKGIPVLLADLDDLNRVASAVPTAARLLIKRFWPGPLTLILPRHPGLPTLIAPDDTVAVRIPDHEIARALIRAAGGTVATTSANLSSHPAARNAQEAMDALNGRVAAILDGGPSPGELASTIVDCTKPEPIILRAGPISAIEVLDK